MATHTDHDPQPKPYGRNHRGKHHQAAPDTIPNPHRAILVHDYAHPSSKRIGSYLAPYSHGLPRGWFTCANSTHTNEQLIAPQSLPSAQSRKYRHRTRHQIAWSTFPQTQHRSHLQNLSVCRICRQMPAQTASFRREAHSTQRSGTHLLERPSAPTPNTFKEFW